MVVELLCLERMKIHGHSAAEMHSRRSGQKRGSAGSAESCCVHTTLYCSTGIFHSCLKIEQENRRIAEGNRRFGLLERESLKDEESLSHYMSLSITRRHTNETEMLACLWQVVNHNIELVASLMRKTRKFRPGPD